MKKLSDMVTTACNSPASMKQSLMDGKEYSHQKEITAEERANQAQQGFSTTCVTMGTINKLFAKLMTRYGNQWASQWADERVLKLAKNEWYEELKSFRNGDVKRGLDEYRGEYPPNVIQFVSACKTGSPAPCYQTWKSESDIKYIENRTTMKASKETGNKSLSAIREMMK